MAPPPVDVAAIARAAAEEALERFVPYGLPDPTGTPPDGLPYRWNEPWRYTIFQPPYKPPGSPVTMETLRNFAEYCDILQSAILTLTREVWAVPIQVVPQDPKDKSDATRARCREAQDWLEKRSGGLGGRLSTRDHFEARCINDLCIVGASALYWQNNRRGELLCVLPLDAATIRPRVDIYGWDAEEPYEQWVYGVQMRAFRETELTYDGLYPLTWSPYFKSPTEYLISVIDAELNCDTWNAAWLTEGTGGSEKLALPADWTPEQVMNWQAYWKSLLAGNISARQRTLWVPSGTTKLNDPSRKDQDFQEFSLYLLRRICAIFGVQPASMGYTGGQYKHTQEDSMASTTQFGAGALLRWRLRTYNECLERLGFDDLHCQDVSGEEESEAARAERLTSLVAGTIMTPNEARAVEGLDPQEGGDTLLVSSTLTPLEHALIPPPDPLALIAAKTAAAPGGGGSEKAADDQPEPGASKPAEKPDDTQRMLADWERLSLKRLAAGKGADLLYRGLPDELTQRVYAGLVNCRDAEAVRAVFAAQEGTNE